MVPTDKADNSPPAEKADPAAPSTIRIALSISLAFVETLLFSGVFYGVVSLVPMLRVRGVYSHLCTQNSSSASDVNSTTTTTSASATSSCDGISSQITLAFTITQVVTPFVNLASGQLLDRLGFRAVKGAAAGLFGLGSLCYALAQPGFDWLIFPGTIMLGISGIQVLIANLQLAPMVRTPFVVSSLICGLFDACAMVTSALDKISQSGINSFIACGVYTALGVLTITLSIILYPGKHSLIKMDEDEKQSQPERASTDPPAQEAAESSEKSLKSCSKSAKKALRQLWSTEFFLMVLWLICNQLRLNYFFGSLYSYLHLVIPNDKDKVNHYANIFGYFFLASPVFVLLPGGLLDLQKRFIPILRQNTPRAYKLNTVSTLVLTALVGAASCLMLLSNTVEMLIPVFVVFTLHRSLLFSTLGNYCISAFPSNYFGLVYSCLLCTAAPFMFLTVPLNDWMKASRNLSRISWILTGLCALSLVQPVVLLLRNVRCCTQRRQSARQCGPMELPSELEWNTKL